VKWFKFYGQDFLTDSKLSGLNPYQRLMWVTILCMASQDDKKTGILKHLDEARVVELSGLNYEDMYSMYGVKKGETLVTFCDMGLVTPVTGGGILVTNYSKKQLQQTSSAERMALYRAKKGKITDVTNVTNVTSHSDGRIEKSRLDKISIVGGGTHPHKKEKEEESPFNWESYLKGMMDSKQRHIRVVGLFFKETGKTFSSKASVEVAINRHAKAATQVAKFSNEEIRKAVNSCKKMKGREGEPIRWTLETVIKELSK